jgi:hypothetical protein
MYSSTQGSLTFPLSVILHVYSIVDTGRLASMTSSYEIYYHICACARILFFKNGLFIPYVQRTA